VDTACQVVALALASNVLLKLHALVMAANHVPAMTSLRPSACFTNLTSCLWFFHLLTDVMPGKLEEAWKCVREENTEAELRERSSRWGDPCEWMLAQDYAGKVLQTCPSTPFTHHVRFMLTYP
jgi:hypothetical protein